MILDSILEVCKVF